MKNGTKKGYFFSMDALIAVIIILIVSMVIDPAIKQRAIEMNVQEDILKTLSTIKIGEINNSYVKQLIGEGKVDNLNSTVLEQIGEFYAKEMPEAELLAKSILDDINSSENIGLWFNNQLIASKNKTSYSNADRIWTARETISGIQRGHAIKGFSSRAFLSKADKVKYFYFGGYVGDGNITAEIDYNGSIRNARIEIAFASTFDLYINGLAAESYSANDSLKPTIIDLSNHTGKFHPGTNSIEFRSQQALYIAGGYIKISYQDAEIFESESKHKLPGITGYINLYDSFFVPNTLNSMEISLHYNSSKNIFLTIGNKTVYSGNSSGNITTVFLNNSYLSSIIDYNTISNRTTPFRIGLENVSYNLSFVSGNVDVILITDVSGSMDWMIKNDSRGQQRNCSDPNLYNETTQKLSLAKCLDHEFIDIVLNISGNRIGLVHFSDSAYGTSLSNNKTFLNNTINAYTASGGTCICCALNYAYNTLKTNSSSGRYKFVILMSDGIAGKTCRRLPLSGCNRTGTGTTSSCSNCGGGLSDCIGTACNDAIANANWSSCRLYNDLNTTVNTIGFGNVVDCINGNKTLNWVASCGGGSYYGSNNATSLKKIYEDYALDIIRLAYKEQSIISVGNANITTWLYPDSYIKLNYPTQEKHGLIMTIETGIFGNSITEGSIYVTNDSEVLDAKIISYTGSQWTDKLKIYNETSSSWETIFDLGDYGLNYTSLGDPYAVYIPVDKLKKSENMLWITKGLAWNNNSGGSAHNKAIYTLVKPAAGYSPIVPSADGCRWSVQFEDDTNMTIIAPLNYTGYDACAYHSASTPVYNTNDAIDIAVYNFFRSIDLDNDRKLDVKFSEQDIQLNSIEITGIPFLWSTEVQTRVWR